MQVHDDNAVLCQMPGCSELELLPTKCNKCTNIFCKTHFPYEAHRCYVHHDNMVPVCPVCGVNIGVPQGESADRLVSLHIDSGCKTHLASSVPQGGGSAMATSAAKGKGGGLWASSFSNIIPCGGSSSTSRSGGRILGGAAMPGLNTHPTRLNYCSLSSCGKNEAVLVLCPKCHSSFCVEHRHPHDHACPRDTPQPEETPIKIDKPLGPKQQPYDLRSRQFQNTFKTSFYRTKVENGITVAIFVERTSNVAPFFITITRRSVMGLVLDMICKEANIRNNNNSSPEEDKWFIFCLSAPDVCPITLPIPPSMIIADICRDGDVLFLGKGPELPEGVHKQIVGNPITPQKVVQMGSGKRTSDKCSIA